jgi:hypothetical protein
MPKIAKSEVVKTRFNLISLGLFQNPDSPVQDITLRANTAINSALDAMKPVPKAKASAPKPERNWDTKKQFDTNMIQRLILGRFTDHGRDGKLPDNLLNKIPGSIHVLNLLFPAPESGVKRLTITKAANSRGIPVLEVVEILCRVITELFYHYISRKNILMHCPNNCAIVMGTFDPQIAFIRNHVWNHTMGHKSDPPVGGSAQEGTQRKPAVTRPTIPNLPEINAERASKGLPPWRSYRPALTKWWVDTFNLLLPDIKISLGA